MSPAPTGVRLRIASRLFEARTCGDPVTAVQLGAEALRLADVHEISNREFRELGIYAASLECHPAVRTVERAPRAPRASSPKPGPSGPRKGA